MQIEALIPMLDVADVHRSMQYYRELGFEPHATLESAGATTWAMLRNGEQRLMLRLSGRMAASVEPRGGAVLHLMVASAEQTHAELEQAGLQPTAVTRQPYGMPAFHLRDPDGYEIAVCSEPMQIA